MCFIRCSGLRKGKTTVVWFVFFMIFFTLSFPPSPFLQINDSLETHSKYCTASWSILVPSGTTQSLTLLIIGLLHLTYERKESSQRRLWMSAVCLSSSSAQEWGINKFFKQGRKHWAQNCKAVSLEKGSMGLPWSKEKKKKNRERCAAGTEFLQSFSCRYYNMGCKAFFAF